MNLYRFIVDTDNIKSDNIFTVQAKTYEEARKEIIEITTRHPFTYLVIQIVYSDDKTVDCDYRTVFKAIANEAKGDL